MPRDLNCIISVDCTPVQRKRLSEMSEAYDKSMSELVRMSLDLSFDVMESRLKAARKPLAISK